MSKNDILDTAKDVVDAEKVVFSSSVAELKKVLGQASREGARRGYASGFTHGAAIGVLSLGVALVYTRRAGIQVHAQYENVPTED